MSRQRHLGVNAEQAADAWVKGDGYPNVAAWATDNGYKPIAGEWFDAYGSPVDIIEAVVEARAIADSYEAA